MALTLTQLQDYINTNVKKNGRNAITGDQMNYLMLNFVDWVNSNTALPDKATNALKFLRVNAAETGGEWVSIDTVAATGTVIDFTLSKRFNSHSSPATGNITDDLTNARAGIVQKIYHNHSVAPTVPAGWVLIGSGTYTTSVLNIVYAEWVSGTRVEYWIVQEA